MGEFLRVDKETAKPVVAMQFTRDKFAELEKFTEGRVSRLSMVTDENGNIVCYCTLTTNEGFPGFNTSCTVNEGDYVMRTSVGGYRVIYAKFFKEHYTPMPEG